MTNAHERHLITSYLANAAKQLHHRDPAATALVEWLVIQSGGDPAFANRRLLSRLEKEDISSDTFDDWISARQMRGLRKALRDECVATQHAQPDLTTRRIRNLARTTGLNRTDVSILQLLLRYQVNSVLETLFDDILRARRSIGLTRSIKDSVLSVFLGIPASTISARLADGAPLVKAGLIAIEHDSDITIVDRLRRLAETPRQAGLDVNHLLLDAAPAGELQWSDFDHVAEDRNHVERLVRGALKSNATGVNILLYGPPGTGKTEFSKVLARQLGVTLYSVGETDDGGDEPSRCERLQELRLAQRLLSRDKQSLLLFDEMEDLLSDSKNSVISFGTLLRHSSGNTGSKVFMNRLLEQAPAPTLWAMNDPSMMGPALLRRMSFALELRLPSTKVRARVWTRQLERHGIKAKADQVRALAHEFAAPPGVAAGATAAARLSGGDVAAVRRGVRSLSRLLSCEMPSQEAPALFDPALIRADTDPIALADRIEQSGQKQFSLCLQGPPGTGKSAFVRYLAERMGLEVMQKRASDLMSKYVGETEQLIDAAFTEARENGAFLILDEIDSLLADRRGAEHQWEVSQVNEMLTQMEDHPLPFACTTNFGDHLDEATLRRFVLKVTLDYLSPEQAEAAFRTYFDLTPPTALATLTTLTPGDFAVVHRKAAVLGQLDEPARLTAMLSKECDAKPKQTRPIGFRGPQPPARVDTIQAGAAACATNA